MVAGAMQTYLTPRALTHDGIAKITRQTTSEDDDGDVTYKLHYRYGIETLTENHARNVPAAFFESHPTGTIFPIRMSAERPKIHALYPGQLKEIGRTSFIFGAIFLAFGGVVFWRIGRHELPNRQQEDWPDV